MPVPFFISLSKYHSDDQDQLKKRALRIISPFNLIQSTDSKWPTSTSRPQGAPDKKVVRGGRDKVEPQAAQFTTRFEQLLIQSKVPTEICSLNFVFTATMFATHCSLHLHVLISQTFCLLMSIEPASVCSKISFVLFCHDVLF